MNLYTPERIALIGTHGTGKTGLVKLISAELIKNGFSVEEVTEIARTIRRAGLPLNESTTFEAQEAILLHQRAAEIIAEFERPDAIVCDRSVLDNLMYLLYGFETKGIDFYPGKTENFIKTAVQEIESQIEEYIFRKPYTAMFYVPIISEEIESDGIRSEDKRFQVAIDEKLRKYFNTCNVRNLYMLSVEGISPGRPEWICYIKNVLKRERNLKLDL